MNRPPRIKTFEINGCCCDDLLPQFQQLSKSLDDCQRINMILIIRGRLDLTLAHNLRRRHVSSKVLPPTDVWDLPAAQLAVLAYLTTTAYYWNHINQSFEIKSSPRNQIPVRRKPEVASHKLQHTVLKNSLISRYYGGIRRKFQRLINSGGSSCRCWYGSSSCCSFSFPWSRSVEVVHVSSHVGSLKDVFAFL